MAYISEESILEVKNAANLVEVVSGYLPLKRRGSSYWATCPFHEEKTASFHVVPDRQFYKCFGCGAKGGVLDFIQNIEKIDFPQAVALLAEKTGVTLKYVGGGSSGPRREDLRRVHEWAAGVYRQQLTTSAEAEPAREFLSRRGVRPETAEAWRLGYAPDSWDGLITRAQRNGFDLPLLVAAGLAVERQESAPGRGAYDRFRGRLMFPIFDVLGKVIGFGARTLKDGQPDQPKFINSPETALFQKGRQLFGLHTAKEEAEETRTLAIVEGYLDVIVPWQEGVRGLVATLGTALTRDHLKLLRRYADRVVLVFDSDEAGQKAAERGLELLMAEDLDLFVAQLPAGEDADDVVLRRGAGALKEVLSQRKDVFKFLVETLESRMDASTPQGRARLVSEIMERIARVPDAVRRECLLQEVAFRYRIDEGTLRSRIERESRAGSPGGRAMAPPAEDAVPTAVKAARGLLALMVQDAGAADRIRREVPVERFPDVATRAVVAKAYELHDRCGAVSGSDLLALVRDEEARSALTEALALPFDPKRASRQLEDCLEVLKVEEFRAQAGTAKGVADAEELQRRVVEGRRGAPRNLRSLPKPGRRA